MKLKRGVGESVPIVTETCRRPRRRHKKSEKALIELRIANHQIIILGDLRERELPRTLFERLLLT